jgi:hypothetical protein
MKARMMRDNGEQPPDHFLPPPPGPHPEADNFYLHAFFDLTTCRAIGMDLGPIPWTAIVAYADRAGLDPAGCEAFVAVIRTLDGAYLADERARVQAQKEKPRG